MCDSTPMIVVRQQILQQTIMRSCLSDLQGSSAATRSFAITGVRTEEARVKQVDQID